MQTQARPLVRDGNLFRQSQIRAFTLIELLTVITIIGILAAITINVAMGVRTRAAIGKARSELSVIAQALESYKKQYGDYPQTDDSHAFLNALAGRRGPRFDAALNGIKGKNFLELSKFTLADSNPANTGTLDPATSTVTLADPWGFSYIYRYKPSGETTWTHSYVLYSKGPPNSLNKDDPSSGDSVQTDTSGLVTNVYDNNGKIYPAFANYIFATQ